MDVVGIAFRSDDQRTTCKTAREKRGNVGIEQVILDDVGPCLPEQSREARHDARVELEALGDDVELIAAPQIVSQRHVGR